MWKIVSLPEGKCGNLVYSTYHEKFNSTQWKSTAEVQSLIRIQRDEQMRNEHMKNEN